jgi:hypothetical protein
VVRAAGGALNFNSNGLNVNDIDDDNSNSNMAVASRVPRTSVSLFFSKNDQRTWSLSQTFEPAPEHTTDIIN